MFLFVFGGGGVVVLLLLLKMCIDVDPELKEKIREHEYANEEKREGV